MCSNSCGSLEPSSTSSPSSGWSLCKRCNLSSPIVLLRRRDAYCSSCFLSMCRQKFRSTLGKHKTLRKQDEPVLIVLDCSPSSIMMTQLFIEMLNNCDDDKDEEDKNTNAKRNGRWVKIRPSLLLIDDSSLFPRNELKRRLETALHFDLDVFVVSIESSLSPNFDCRHVGRAELRDQGEVKDKQLKEELVSLLDSCSDLSSKQTLLKHLRQLCILNSCRTLQFDKAFVSDTSTDVAVAILTGLAEGRGAQLPLDVGYEAHFNSDKVPTTLYRPMREFTSKEITFFNRLLNKDNLSLVNFDLNTLKRKDASIMRLTEKFVVGLQQDYSATISTVFRTGDKLVIRETEFKCKLCLGNVETNSHAFHATNLSKLISNSKLDHDVLRKSDPNKSMENSDSEPDLCYGCSITLHNFQRQPKFLTNDKLRENIDEYLL